METSRAEAEALAYFQKSGESGESLYSQLTDVLATILITKPANALDAFESISQQVKEGRFTAAAAVAPPAPTEAPVVDSAWEESNLALLKPSSEEEVDASLTPLSLLEESLLFEWAGVGFSRAEVYRIYASLCKLQQSRKLETVRFFGKILGTTKDYYVAEAKYVEQPEQPEPDPDAPPPAVPAEEYGTGCNAFTYFVTTDPAAPWEALPMVTPEVIAAATLVRKYFTGDLDAQVRCFPPFPGKERQYLRAQIARLVHGTTLCPGGKYRLTEEGLVEEVPKDEEGYTPPTNASMGRHASWLHFHKGILVIGRTTNLPVPEEEPAEGVEPAPKPPAPEPEKPALTQIAPADWSVVGPSHIGGGAAVSVSRCLRWPGAVAVAEMKEDTFANLYVGYGHEAAPGPTAPQPPPPMVDEEEELIEAAEMPLEQENAAFQAAAEAALAAGGEE